MAVGVKVATGEVVHYEGRFFKILKILDVDRVLGQDIADKAREVLDVTQLRPIPKRNQDKPVLTDEITAISKQELAEARKRFKAISPLLDLPERSRSKVEARSKETGVHPSTLYRWLALYDARPQLTSLVSGKRGGKGKPRLDSEAEKILSSVIDDVFLSPQRYSVVQVHQVVIERCRQAGIKPPGSNTLRRRISTLSPKMKYSRRGQRKKARALESTPGTYTDADVPLAVVQMDHTPADIIIVDDYHRLPIGRPYFTTAIDVFSRMVLGFSISLDPPSGISVADCLAHAILPKENWLAKRKLDLPWPAWGIPRTVHLDNAREFRSQALELGCELYNIRLEWRPVSRPHFGGHVERWIRTVSEQTHGLPGTTFSNVQQRVDYDSEGRACLTLTEFEIWLTKFFLGVYHQKIHGGIGETPLARFKRGILGGDDSPGIGDRFRVTDENRLKIDFMPIVKRTIQSYGFTVDTIRYYHDVLSPLVESRETPRSRKGRKYLIRYDPRDISVMYLLEPEQNTYLPIPYRNIGAPRMSIWERDRAIRNLRKERRGKVDEDIIFKTIESMRQLVDVSTELTKTARREKQRAENHRQTERLLHPAPPVTPPPVPSTSETPKTSRKYKPFEQIEDITPSRVKRSDDGSND